MKVLPPCRKNRADLYLEALWDQVELFFHLLGPWRVIVSTGPLGQVRKHHGLDVGACGHLPDDVQGHMFLRRLPHNAGLLGRDHGLPATVVYHLLHPTLARRGFRDEQIGSFRKFSDSIARASIATTPCCLLATLVYSRFRAVMTPCSSASMKFARSMSTNPASLSQPLCSCSV